MVITFLLAFISFLSREREFPSANEMSVHFALSYITYLMTDIYVYLCYSSKPAVPSNVLSMTQLKTMDLPDQVKALLINGEL